MFLDNAYRVTITRSMTDEQIETLRAAALRDEDFDMFDLCETALKMIVQPNLKRQAIERIVDLLCVRYKETR